MNLLNNIKLKDFLLVPNIVSILRIFLVIPFGYTLTINEWWGVYAILCVAIIIGASDFLDGILARKLNQISDLGKMLDPISDKVILIVGTILLVIYKDFPIWILITFIIKDILTSIAGIMASKKQNKIRQSNFLG